MSKFLSLVLRHRPGVIGVSLDDQGWADVEELLAGCRAKGRDVTREQLAEVVSECPKQRFAWSDDGQRIRASQGHSVAVELDYEPTEPPEILYHGTVAVHLSGIRVSGLVRRKRHHVHLSRDVETARQVGGRRGAPVILTVRAGAMAQDGFVFFVSANGVWLTEHVPVEYLELPE